MKVLATCLIALAATLAMKGENVLDDDAFWNKNTAYAEPAVETAIRVLDSSSFEFANAWDLVLVFTENFNGKTPEGLVVIVR